MENINLKGLTTEEVSQRISEGKVNAVSTLKTKSYKRIFYDNICTLFNLVNVILFILMLLVGSYKNMLFIGVVFFNTAIGIIQEIRSKISVDKLTILTESKVKVIRNGEQLEINKDELVLDDIIILSRGSQIPADCVLVSGDCKVNESLLTGESNLIEKKPDDELLSGSFVSGGKCYARVNRVGADCYAAKINNEAKYIKKNDSQILKSFKFIIKLCTFIIFPMGIALFVSKFFIQGGDFQSSVISTTAALIGTIPSGMILLTSTVLAVSVIRLSQRKVLVNEMYCIETLARVDVLCLDKTGTLTSESMTVTDVKQFDNSLKEIKTALSSIYKASEDKNATINAVGDYTSGKKPLDCEKFIGFSSETKWSGGKFSDGKTYVIGASEFVFSDKEKYKDVFDKINEISDTVRILALAVSDKEIENNKLPDDLTPMALVLIKDKLRDNVQDTVNYFKEQGVTLKVISGDSVKTVQNIAKDTGIEGAERAVDMTEITTDEQLAEVAENCNVFGRVTPEQKKKLVLALKAKGHKVAMTGDGVNDVLALKEADCSVAMASGSEAARNVSQLVLIDNDFAAMPQVVYEGRKTINNIERSSSLYLVKTIYSIVLSIFFIFIPMQYPFEPVQLTLIGALTIGFPSFVLALQPNKNIVRGNFTFNIFARAVPAAVCVFLSIIISEILCGIFGIPFKEFSTIAVFVTALICFLLDLRLSLPLNFLRGAMLAVTVAGFIIAFSFFGNLFSLTFLSTNGIIIFVIIAVVSAIVFNILFNVASKLIEKDKNKIRWNIVYPKDVRIIIEKLNNSGFEGYIVGGCVRDCIMNKVPHDWDICTNAKPDEIESCFDDFKTLDIGKKHGTIGVVINDKLYEITTYRVDGEYLDNRRPESVEFTSDIKNDLSRRDFTINAMAYNEINGLADPFGGRQDIKNKQIKCVGNATERFHEDSLRILRGLRFASRFDFEIEKKTSKAIHLCKELLNNVAYERIRVELMGIICGKSTEKILNDYRDVIAIIIPEIIPCFDFQQNTPHHCLDVYRHIARSVGNIESDPLLRLTMLLHDIGKPKVCTTDENGRSHFKGHPKISAEIADGILKRLRFSNAIIADCLMLIEYHDVRFKGNKKTVKRVAGKIGIDNTKRLFKIQYADTMAQSEYYREQKLSDIKTAQTHLDEIIKDSECFSLKQLAVNGYDLKALGFSDGKQIGYILNDLYEKVIGDELPNDKEALINFINKK